VGKMRKSVLIKTIIPKTLKALREMHGFTMEEIAKKLKTSAEKIKQVEEGGSFFTLSQIKKLADVYHISLAAFFSDSIPQIPVIPDYRLNREKRLGPQVFRAQKKACYLSKELAMSSDRESTIPSFGETEATYLANAFRKFLELEIIKNKTSNEILKRYKSAVEEKMFVPIIEYPFKAKDVRAFSMLSKVSIIALNENDKPEVKLFSLFHEIGHLLRKNSGLCSIDIEFKNQQEIETYCNQFSAEFLVPQNDLKIEIRNRGFSQFNYEAVSGLAQVYGVSKQVIMLRLLWLGFVAREEYHQFKNQYQEPMEKKKSGRKNWEEVFFNRAGGLILREIEMAYKRGDISPIDITTILGMRAKYIEKFINL
jgi:Zn-dependent peptidase ImmA (M78 family)/DNA-binding XRE family transcriptional regulator